MNKRIVVIGAGPAGLAAAAALSVSPHQVTILEREAEPGGKLRDWDHLFPNFVPAKELLEEMTSLLSVNNTVIRYSSAVHHLVKTHDRYVLHLGNGEQVDADVVIISTGYDLFAAEKKEEYGYGLYPHVITSADLEKMLKNGTLPESFDKRVPQSIAFVHCVGSRDLKVGNLHCSRVCCVTGVKQAIELCRLFPKSRITSFYMDLRMYANRFEELYKEAQESYKVRFIRGRVSELAEHSDHSIQLKAEDTLSGRPIKMNFDWVVLLVGMNPPAAVSSLNEKIPLLKESSGFFAPKCYHFHANETNLPGIFLTGTCKEPLSIQETIADARSGALKALEWIATSN